MLAMAAALWAGTFIVGRALRFDIPPVAAAFWRWLIACTVLLLLVLPRLHAAWPVLKRQWLAVGVLGTFATALHHIPLFIGLHDTTATNTALLYATSPVFIILFARMAFAIPIAGRALAGIAVAIAGVVVITLRGEWSRFDALTWNPGDAWVLLGTISWAAYVTGLRHLDRTLDAGIVLFATAAVGVVVMLPLYLTEILSGKHVALTPANIGALLYLGVAATVVGYLLWQQGVAQIGAERAGPYMYLMTAFTPLFAALALDERLALFHLVGTTLILGGVFMATSRSTSRHTG